MLYHYTEVTRQLEDKSTLEVTQTVLDSLPLTDVSPTLAKSFHSIYSQVACISTQQNMETWLFFTSIFPTVKLVDLAIVVRQYFRGI